jgi:hypothetical protein
MEGNLHKMPAVLTEGDILYKLHLSEEIEMNALVGKRISIVYAGRINCLKCEKKTKNSFGEGFCYPCFSSAPEAAECIIRPELCRAHLGEGRDVEWEERNHNTPHVVYFAATDIVKVGVTRSTQVPTRWIDQGASSAIRVAETPNRYEAGRLEVALKSEFADKTNWRKMLRNEVNDEIDLEEEKWSLHDRLPSDLTTYFTEDDEIIELNYPVDEFPEKVTSLNLDKSPNIEGVLKGIKGQYLIFEGGKVFNVRRHTGYFIELNIID